MERYKHLYSDKEKMVFLDNVTSQEVELTQDYFDNLSDTSRWPDLKNDWRTEAITGLLKKEHPHTVVPASIFLLKHLDLLADTKLMFKQFCLQDDIAFCVSFFNAFWPLRVILRSFGLLYPCSKESLKTEIEPLVSELIDRCIKAVAEKDQDSYEQSIKNFRVRIDDVFLLNGPWAIIS